MLLTLDRETPFSKTLPFHFEFFNSNFRKFQKKEPRGKKTRSIGSSVIESFVIKIIMA